MLKANFMCQFWRTENGIATFGKEQSTPGRAHHNHTMKLTLPRDKAMDKENEILGAPGKPQLS